MNTSGELFKATNGCLHQEGFFIFIIKNGLLPQSLEAPNALNSG
jgi:hypothetical protein